MRINLVYIITLLLFDLFKTMTEHNSLTTSIKTHLCLSLSRELAKQNKTYANDIKHLKFHKRISQILSFGLANCFNSITQAQIIKVYPYK